jgi:hypothetical protein
MQRTANGLPAICWSSSCTRTTRSFTNIGCYIDQQKRTSRADTARHVHSNGIRMTRHPDQCHPLRGRLRPSPAQGTATQSLLSPPTHNTSENPVFAWPGNEEPVGWSNASRATTINEAARPTTLVCTPAPIATHRCGTVCPTRSHRLINDVVMSGFGCCSGVPGTT